MAEVLGLVASSIAVVQLAGSVGKTVLKGKSFLDRIEYVPDRIKTLLRQLEIQSEMLSDIEKHLLQTPLPKEVWNSTSAHASTEYCREVTDEFFKLTYEMHAEIETKRNLKKKVASMKVALKRETIQRLEEKLKIALDMVQSAIQYYNAVLAKANLEANQMILGLLTRSATNSGTTVECDDASAQQQLIEDVRPANSGVEVSIRTTKLSQRRPFSSEHTFMSIFFGRLRTTSSPDGETWSAVYRAPWWLATRVWEVESQRVWGNWQRQMRSYNIRPDDASIFQLIDIGDAKGVLEAFKNGEASPFDRTVDGASLLHYALTLREKNWVACASVCRELVALGLDESIDEPDELNSTPRTALMCSGETLLRARLDDKDENALEHFSMTMELFDKSSPVPITEESACDLLIRWSMYYEPEPLIWFQKRFAPSYYDSFPLPMRLDAAHRALENSVTFSCYLNPDVVRIHINKGSRLTEESLRTPNVERTSLVHSVAKLYGIRCHEAYERADTEGSRLAYQELLQDIISVAPPDLLHAMLTDKERTYTRVGPKVNQTATLLQSFLQGALQSATVQPRQLRPYLNHMLMQWLQSLANCGLNLREYGEAERRALQAQRAGTQPCKKGTVAWDPESKMWKYRAVEWDQDVKLWANKSSEDVYAAVWDLPLCLLDMKYGAEPRYWSLLWDIDFECMVGEFWSNFDEPVIEKISLMPGSWVD